MFLLPASETPTVSHRRGLVEKPISRSLKDARTTDIGVAHSHRNRLLLAPLHNASLCDSDRLMPFDSLPFDPVTHPR